MPSNFYTKEVQNCNLMKNLDNNSRQFSGHKVKPVLDCLGCICMSNENSGCLADHVKFSMVCRSIRSLSNLWKAAILRL